MRTRATLRVCGEDKLRVMLLRSNRSRCLESLTRAGQFQGVEEATGRFALSRLEDEGRFASSARSEWRRYQTNKGVIHLMVVGIEDCRRERSSYVLELQFER